MLDFAFAIIIAAITVTFVILSYAKRMTFGELLYWCLGIIVVEAGGICQSLGIIISELMGDSYLVAVEKHISLLIWVSLVFSVIIILGAILRTLTSESIEK